MNPDDNQPNEENNQAHEIADTWGDAEAAFLADKGIKTEEKKDPADEEDPNKPADNGADDPSKNGGEDDPDKKPEDSEEESDPNDDPDLEQPDDKNAAYREARQVQKELEADRQAMQADVQKELYPDWNDDILDADGEPLRTPRDVMGHINPATKTKENPQGRRFTEEEATAWLFAAQKHKDTQRAEMQQRVEKVSEVMIDQRDQADQVKEKYGDLLTKLPNLRKEIWADYRATLVVDKETGLIVDAPVPLYNFFERALRPYAEYQKQLEAQAANTPNKAQTETQRKQTQADREDIHSASGGSITDPEEEGWAKAAKEYYEG